MEPIDEFQFVRNRKFQFYNYGYDNIDHLPMTVGGLSYYI